MPPPADLVSFRNQVQDEQNVARARSVAPDQVEQAMRYGERAEKACDDNEGAACEHFSTLAKYKFATAMEMAEAIDAEQRQAAAMTRTMKANKVAQREDQRRQRLEQVIARMERISDLQQRVADASNLAEAAKLKATMAREQAQLNAQAHGWDKAKLDRLMDRDALFSAAIQVVGQDNVKRVKRGIVLTFRGLFASGKAMIKPDMTQLISQLADVARRYPGYTMLVEGHTDDRGADTSNLALSQGRAQAVVNELLSNQIPMNRLKAVGIGEAQPISDNSTAEGRAINRRVDVVFLF